MHHSEFEHRQASWRYSVPNFESNPASRGPSSRMRDATIPCSRLQLVLTHGYRAVLPLLCWLSSLVQIEALAGSAAIAIDV